MNTDLSQRRVVKISRSAMGSLLSTSHVFVQECSAAKHRKLEVAFAVSSRSQVHMPGGQYKVAALDGWIL